MKRAIVITAAVLASLYFYNVMKKNRAYEMQQACVATAQGQGVQSVVDSARAGTAEGFFQAAEAFGSWPSVRDMADGVFTELGPVDACFAERLYVRAAQLGSRPALDRLESLYDCDFPLNHGAASETGLSEVRKVASGELEATQLASTINVDSYSAGSLRCGISRPLVTCQRPDFDSAAYLTKQDILCAGVVGDGPDLAAAE